ncbi:MAG TPA: beta-propeller fold lactonase family protein [Vicinamibacterales bacterium]
MQNRRVFAFPLLTFVVAAAIPRSTIPLDGQSGEFVHFEGSQTNPIRLSADGTRLFAVNTANASLSVFDVSRPRFPDLIGEIPVGLEPVSVNPLSNDEAWVVNQLSDSISIVSVSRGIVIDTLRTGDEPMDVVFAGSDQAYVTVSGANAIIVSDTTSRAVRHVLPVFGGSPRALAVSPDGDLVYAAFALSGNGTTLIRSDLAPPQPPPTNGNLPPAPQVGKIVPADDPEWSSVINFQMPDNDVAVIATGSSPRIAGYYSGVGTINLGLAVHPENGDLFVANTEARNLIPFLTSLRGHWVDNRITRVAVATGRVTPFDLNPSIDYSTLPNPEARATALAQPTSVVFDPDGEFMYVAAFGTDRVARVDTGGNVLWFVEVSPPSGSGSNVDPRTKRGPRGLALAADGRYLYVLNRISNTISVVDTRAQGVVRELPVGADPTPAGVRIGRGFLYDAKLSGNGTGSCASCHVDGDVDRLAWDLGDPGGEMQIVRQGLRTFEFHPMKGPMTTQSLRGLAGLAPFHWRGDRANLQEFNGAFPALMGGSEVSDFNMLTYATFINTIRFPPNPNQNLDRSMPGAIGPGNPAAGQEAFLTVAETRVPDPRTCNSCHRANPGPGTSRVIIRGPDQALKVPHLRNMYQKDLFNRFAGRTIDGFGMDHDGHVSTFLDFFAADIFATYSRQQKLDLTAYMLSFDTGTAPAVGYSLTMNADNIDDGGVQTDWATLRQQAEAQDIELVANGTINGQVRRLIYRPSQDDYVIDQGPFASFSNADLQTLVEQGDTLTLMGRPLPLSETTQAAPDVSRLSGGRKPGH